MAQPEASNSPRMIAISSGKGGVGKSTVTANIAVAMAEAGLERSQLNVYLILERALALEALGRTEEAQIALEDAWTINPAIFMEALLEARFSEFQPPQQ